MKAKIIFAGLMIIATLSSCNYQAIDLHYNYNYAIIQLPNGEIVEGKVDSWRDYEDGEQLQVTIDGVTYLCSSYNCVLLEHKEK